MVFSRLDVKGTLNCELRQMIIDRHGVVHEFTLTVDKHIPATTAQVLNGVSVVMPAAEVSSFTTLVQYESC